MTSKAELDKGIAAIKSAYRRESNARNVLAHMLDEKERENAKLRKLVHDAVAIAANVCISCPYYAECDILQDGTCIGEEKICERAEEMGIKVGL